MNHINTNFRNHAKYTDNHLYKTEGKLRYLEASSWRNGLRIDGFEEGKEEADDGNWDQRKVKVRSILKFKLKIM